MATNNNEITEISCTNGLRPLVRNQYFYGKLLTVRDFQNEQSYHIKKQRLINRHIHGEGVVCGLVVEKTESKVPKIRIKSGMALDCCGREIVVPEDEVMDLPTEEGKYWVVLHYSECGKEQVAAATNANSCEENCCFSRIEEGYTIEILNEAPEVCSSFQADELCNSWKSLKFGKKVGGKLPNKILHLFQQIPKVFVEQYQGVCLPAKEDSPIILAAINLSQNAESISIDNALVNKVGFDKKLVHTNPKLFELLKCAGKEEEETFTKINGYNWEHGKKYLAGVALKGVAKEGSVNTVTLDDASDENGISEGMMIILIRTIDNIHGSTLMSAINSGGIIIQIRTITGYEVDKKKVTVDEDWDTVPDDSVNWGYMIFHNEFDAFFKKLQKLEISFNKDMKKESINTKTLNLIGTEYQIINPDDSQDIEIIKNKMEVPIYFYTDAPNNMVHFGIVELLREGLKKHVFSQLISSREKKGSSLENQNITTKFCTEVLIRLKGDFILDEDGRPIDANHLKGEIPSGNGSGGGLFESWFDLIVDETYLDIALLEIKQKVIVAPAGIEATTVSNKIRLMQGATELILDIMNKRNEISLINGKYFPLPDPTKTIIIYDTQTDYLKVEAEKLSERLKEKGVSVTLKSVADFTDEDKENHEIIFLRGNKLSSGSSTKLTDISSKVKWDKSEGEIEIVHKDDRMSNPVFVIGGKDKLSVEKAVANYVKRYRSPQ